MRFHKQKNLHAPQNLVWGDCERTTIACILDLEVLDVPHFNDSGPTSEEVRRREIEWLNTKGLYPFVIPFNCDLDTLFASMKAMNPGVYYLLAGESSTGVNHSVVCYDDEIIHDPSLVNSGIIGPCNDGYYWITVLAHKGKVS